MSNAPTPEIVFRTEEPHDAAAIERLIARIFGPGANTRAAAFLREGVDHARTLSFIACKADTIIGTCRLTPVQWGGTSVLMLGPLGVDPLYKNAGIGRRLMSETVAATGRPIILVGDLPYYAPFGFARVAPGRISLPRPTDPSRILLRGGVPADTMGAVTRA